ncbi:MAG TPA: hypothetical protein VNI01_08550 [Elusimicrobiota bacterium]|jgi:predicted lipid-binding transport protein (Tim44 family)|nr:hypothetical protein [Elusimicrobiota bacterium]
MKKLLVLALCFLVAAPRSAPAAPVTVDKSTATKPSASAAKTTPGPSGPGISEGPALETLLWGSGGAVVGSFGGPVGALAGGLIGAAIGFVVGTFSARPPAAEPQPSERSRDSSDSASR